MMKSLLSFYKLNHILKTIKIVINMLRYAAFWLMKLMAEETVGVLGFSKVIEYIFGLPDYEILSFSP